MKFFKFFVSFYKREIYLRNISYSLLLILKIMNFQSKNDRISFCFYSKIKFYFFISFVNIFLKIITHVKHSHLSFLFRLKYVFVCFSLIVYHYQKNDWFFLFILIFILIFLSFLSTRANFSNICFYYLLLIKCWLLLIFLLFEMKKDCSVDLETYFMVLFFQLKFASI